MRKLGAFAALLFVVFLWSPLLVLVAKGASPEAFARLWERGDLWSALGQSLLLGVLSATVATLVGTFTALALPHLSKSVRGVANAGLLFPMVLPEIALGLALLVWFNRLGWPLGWATLIVSHAVFSLGFATFVMQGRVAQMDHHIFEAARDLGAGRVSLLRHAWWPQLKPGLVAAWLTAFALSMDSFLLSFFVKGLDQSLLPVQLFSMLRLKIGPEVYALSLLLFCASAGAVLISQLWQHSRKSSVKF